MSTAVGIFSGGLDSILAARVLMDQGVAVRVITFTSPFFGADRALESAASIGLTPVVLDLTDELMPVIHAPKHGFGRFANPCIDCHGRMFARAGRWMEENGGDFLFSGEVLGQRPKSQNLRALNIVATESGYAGRILRPLSARLLPPTRPEEEGLVDRERLLGLSGRSRKPQMALAEQFGIADYPTPAGGCLLTDPVFSRRVKELLIQDRLPGSRDMELLKTGRHFRLPGGSKLIVGRNRLDNETLESLARAGDWVFKTEGVPGPTALLVDPHVGDRYLAAGITASYSDRKTGSVPVRVREGETDQVMDADAVSRLDATRLMV